MHKSETGFTPKTIGSDTQQIDFFSFLIECRKHFFATPNEILSVQIKRETMLPSHQHEGKHLANTFGYHATDEKFSSVRIFTSTWIFIISGVRNGVNLNVKLMANIFNIFYWNLVEVEGWIWMAMMRNQEVMVLNEFDTLQLDIVNKGEWRSFWSKSRV